jgi:hypothetical protein
MAMDRRISGAAGSRRAGACSRMNAKPSEKCERERKSFFAETRIAVGYKK